MRTRIKICGITSVQDAELVVEAGGDALGINFYEKSPRNVGFEQAQSIILTAQPYITTVAVVVDPALGLLNKLEAQSQVDRIQFHGNESDAACMKTALPYYKALRIKSDSDLRQLAYHYSGASALLLDTYVEGIQGGTGKVFDWSLITHQVIEKPIIVAGGLNPQNVYDLIVTVAPYAVDVCSGVESSSGIKDAVKINEFIIAAREADQKLMNNRS